MATTRALDVPGKNILLVDDDPLARESIRLLLNIDRHIVTEAANGLEALELFQSGTFDLVITDYLMPGMLGDELAQSIRSLVPTQPILMITAYLEKLAAAGQPAAAMLGKPLSVDELRRAMAEQNQA
jgi:CheY-like chemotaxis protein